MKTNIGHLDRIIRIIMGAILLTISLIFPLVTTGGGKAVVSIIGGILLLTGFVKY